jgi:hypothetical protein
MIAQHVENCIANGEIVANLVRKFGQWACMSSKDIEDMQKASMYMDRSLMIDPLDIKSHPIHSYNVFGPMREFSETAARIMVEHHERMDGSGYPYGIKGDSIHPLTQIVSICDEYVKNRMGGLTKKNALKNLQIRKEEFGAILSKFIFFMYEHEEEGLLMLI